jgi:stress-induced morphogen
VTLILTFNIAIYYKIGRCTSKISEALSPSKCLVTSTNDDPNGSHIQVKVVSNIFEGKRLMIRHQMVYKAISDELDSGRVHAVDSISAKTPAEDV